MIIDKKGNLFGKINILDILIILVILVFIVLGASKIFSGALGDSGSANTIEVLYTVEVAKKDAEFFESIKEGDVVFKKNTKEVGGEVISCDIKPAKYITANTNKLSYELTEAENKFDGYITIKTTADVSYPDMIVGGDEIKIGKNYDLRTENTVLNGYITSIEYDKEKMGGFAR
ncbi:MAG: DUF4330 domain-containing protein [Ruminococcaceae bacterium]|nr:DUF4330 domain-containing protein [Oscillospiraceae bacterium]